jgi:cellulose synthase/poly-beta-1,6-N-acetylglucosamine synthase-like glycosyltransferase
LYLLSLIFFLSVGIQSIYLITFLIALWRKRSENTANAFPPVSVIVVAHDEEQNLKELIPMLLAQEYPAFEVIIVNDRSNDNTYDFLLEETKKDQRLRLVQVERVPNHVNGKKYGITLGIRAATHEWILLTDADCRPAGSQWIAAMSKQFNDSTRFVLGYSPYEKRPGFLNQFIRFESILTAIQYVVFALLKNPYMGVGRNLVYRKSLFLEKKGFNQFLNVTGGDDDLFVNQHATGHTTTVQFAPEAQVYSIPKTSWPSFFYQKVRHLSVGKRYRLKHRILLGVFALTWMLTWFTGVALLVFDIENRWVIGALVFRMILLPFTIRAFTKQAGQPFNLWLVPLLDFLFSIYYISTGLTALTTKNVQWRK